MIRRYYKNKFLNLNYIEKKFYTVVKNAGFESTELEVLFNSVQIYESVMSITFIVFKNYPDAMKSINESLNEAIAKIENHSHAGCFTLAFCTIAFVSNFNRIIGLIDSAIGKMGIPKIAQHFLHLIDIFCKFCNIDLSDTQRIASLSESIQEIIKNISGKLKSLFGDSIIPGSERKSKWGPLAITERIRSKLSKFETQSFIVDRTVKSFESFFRAVESIDDNLQDLKAKTAQQQTARSSDDITEMDNLQPNENKNLAIEILTRHESGFDQIKETARFFQHVETILSYGVLIFKNEDEILNPLLDYVDEGTKILEKYAELHPLYKILLGKNYLSNLKVIVKNIMDLIKNSKLLVNSPNEFLYELKAKYPNLIYLLCESYLNNELKNKLKFLPDSIENALNSQLNQTLSKFKDKFKI
jgi:hypothetical protein